MNTFAAILHFPFRSTSEGALGLRGIPVHALQPGETFSSAKERVFLRCARVLEERDVAVTYLSVSPNSRSIASK